MRVELGAFINPDTVAAASVKSWVGKEVTLEEAVVVLSSTSEEAPEDESGPDVTLSTVTGTVVITEVIGDVDIVVEDECVKVESGEKELFSEFKDVSVEDSASVTPDVVLGVSTSSSFTEEVARVDVSSARA